MTSYHESKDNWNCFFTNGNSKNQSNWKKVHIETSKSMLWWVIIVIKQKLDGLNWVELNQCPYDI